MQVFLGFILQQASNLKRIGFLLFFFFGLFFLSSHKAHCGSESFSALHAAAQWFWLLWSYGPTNWPWGLHICLETHKRLFSVSNQKWHMSLVLIFIAQDWSHGSSQLLGGMGGSFPCSKGGQATEGIWWTHSIISVRARLPPSSHFLFFKVWANLILRDKVFQIKVFWISLLAFIF